MKQNLLKVFAAAMLLFFAQSAFSQGSTTSAINGRVTGNGESLPGATVVALDVPTGSQYGTVTDLDGFYRLPNLNVGGPYKITISFVGFESFSREGIFLQLGQTLNINANLSETATTIEGVEIVAQQRDVFDGNRTGAETYVSREEIQKLPTLSRSIGDFVRFTPQANYNGGLGSISVAGINNRYNAISFDGAVNNDVFGLAASGTNGGQTGGTPISLDAIDQFQIVLAPYDVRQGGFAGASINAVTRRGTNEFEGSAYYLYRNQNYAGKTPGKDIEERTKLADFTANTYGMRLGGPIIKNKLFFFLNAEFQRDETPQPFDFSTYQGNASAEDLSAVANKLRSYEYDPGGYLNNVRELTSDKFLVRFDYNLSQNHRLTLRHSYVKSEAIRANRSSNRTINFFNNGEYFPSTTNSTALELKSNWNTMNNNLIIGFTSVRDDRDPLGGKFPFVTILDGNGTINAGSEQFSTGNRLDQDILTFNNNFSIYKQAHTITFGINVEYSQTYNLFMRQAFGVYRFDNVAAFLADNPIATRYERGYSLVDDVVGDGSKAAADFRTMQFGFYVQDEYQVSDRFKVTAGIRFDIPQYLDKPNAGKNQAVWDDFNTTGIASIESNGYDLKGAKAGEMPRAYLSFDPRLGFNYDVTGDQSTQVRGGIGLFTSRLPLVWPGGSYTNNGVTVGGVIYNGDVEFRSDINNQYTATDFGQSDAIPSGQVDLFTEDFKNPQMLRTSLAVDHKLPWWGLIGTLEGIYTKTINNVTYLNVNQAPSTSTITNGPDQRPYYPNQRILPQYTRIILGTNTNEGFTYNFTAQLTKPLSKGFSGTVAYTYGKAKALNDATSSQNSSQWRFMETIRGLNQLDLSYSDFDMGSRLLAFLSYRVEYANNFASTFSFVYNGQSGQRFSYVYNDAGGRLNNERENAGNLIWIPASQNEINLVDIKNNEGVVTLSAADQWKNLNSFIESDKYLNDNRGGYAERNGARLPFESVIDFKFVQDFNFNVAGKTQTFQLTFDIFNFTNLLNPEWGIRRFITNDALQLITWTGFEEDGKTPKFNYTGKSDVEEIYNVSDVGIYGSRWTGQIGIRYIF